MKLIAEAGSSKIQWGIIHSGKVFEFLTSGFNPNVADRNYLRQLLVSGFPKEFDPNEITSIYYYGTGCGTDRNKTEVNRALSNFFCKSNSIKVSTDLEAVGHAVFNETNGFVGILGTGSSFGLYSERKIKKQAPSLGYLIGDEGSGAHIGRVFLNKLLTQQLPEILTKKLADEMQKSFGQIKQELYKTKTPNAYLASFLPFIKNNIEDQNLIKIIENSLQEYIEIYVVPLIKDYPNQRIGLVGGIAHNFNGILNKVFEPYGLPKPIVIEKPFHKLVELELA